MKALAFLCLAIAITGASAAKDDTPIPDFTKGEEHQEKAMWNFGPTGMRGYIAGRKRETIDTRQMLVSEVAKGSPADKKIEPGDVIIGVDGKPFESDVRRIYADAITAAETEKGGGALNLLVWREGETLSETLELPVLGSYSATAPLDCPKTATIISEAADYTQKLIQEKKGGLNRIDFNIAALGLLATGDKKYLKEVKACVSAVTQPGRLKNVDISIVQQSLCSWDWGYANLLLTEYYLATGDKKVLPAIERYSNAIAEGQSAVGTWGHRMAHPYWNYGEIHGRLYGYGALNQAGIICQLSLALAQKCGVESEEISKAVAKGNTFFRFYADKGSVPYGDHPPYLEVHDSNGKNGTAAVIFQIQGERTPSRFFGAMAAASYRDKERGHTGNYFGFLWGPLGARMLGVEASAAHMKELRWFYEMQRAWDGGFTYQGALGPKAEHRYGGWDTSGSMLLALTAPMGELYINGKGVAEEDELGSKAVDTVIGAGRGYTNWGNSRFKNMDEKELLEQLGSWSPVVRRSSAQAIGKLKTVSPRDLVKMLESGNRFEKYGACAALGELRGKAGSAVPAIIKAFESDDPVLKGLAAQSLPKIGRAADKAIPVLMASVINPDQDDPREMLRRNVADALFNTGRLGATVGLLAKDIENVDDDILTEAIEVLLNNPDGGTRSTTSDVFGLLSKKEIKTLLPEIVDGIKNPAPSGVMFSWRAREAGLKLLARLNISDGIDLCMDPEKTKYWDRVDYRRLAALGLYGSAAAEHIPELEKLRKARVAELNKKKGDVDIKSDRTINAIDNCIAKIKSDKSPPAKLVSLAEYMK